jgi:molybdate transport system ATP-binding protein
VSLRAELALVRGSFALELALEVEAGQTVALVGPNGSGKSTLVEALAGLIPIDVGEITLDGTRLESPQAGIRVAPQQRPIGVMFQGLWLFPHLSAEDNVAYGLRASGAGRREARAAVTPLLARLGLLELAQRRPASLSGGEAQRVALARALAPQPRMLLLDEPLSALDLELRPRTRVFLQEILASFPGPRLVITHEPREALLLADRVVVLERGRVVQQGSPDELRQRPQTPYVARLAGVNLLEGTLDGRRLRAGELSLDVEPGQLGLAAGTPLLATVHPHSVRVERADAEPGHEGAWETLVEGVELEGDRVRIELRQPAGFVAELPAADLDLRRFSPGTAIRASIPRDQISIYPRMAS